MNNVHTLDVGICLQNGKYRIISVLGQGGFGITYLAEQTGLGMRVSIKEFFMRGSCQRDNNTSKVSVPVNDNEELVRRCQKRFKSEARKIASLNNDHIVNIIDVFDENGTSYYVMKYLPGGSLSSLLNQTGPFSETAALKVIGDISDALKSVHSNGLLHLDIKPANILFDERGRAVLIDFGISKYVDSTQDSSTTSSLVGFSRGFAPLEQVNSTVSSLSAATDLYALGATFYNMLTGMAPPEASVVMESGLPKMPDNVCDEVQDAITKAMQPRRKDRPQSIEGFLSLLPDTTKESVSDDTVMANSGSVYPQPDTNRKKGGLLLYISAAMLSAAIILSIITYSNRNRSNDDVSSVLLTELDSLKRANSYLQDEIITLNSAVSIPESRIKQLEDNIKDLNARNSALTRENANLKNEVDSYKPDAERWRRQLQLDN